MSRWLAVVLALCFVPAWSADEVAQQRLQLETALHRLAQEQQAIYQQFQMVQDLRRSEERLALQRVPAYRLPLQAGASFEEAQREEAARQRRMDELQAESERLYGRYRELEEQKRPLLDALSSLALPSPKAER